MAALKGSRKSLDLCDSRSAVLFCCFSLFAVIQGSYNSSPKFANTIPGRQLGAIQPIRSVEEIVALLGPPPYSYVFREDCPKCNKAIWDPVCGSDYRTHPNGECLRRLACRRRRNISIEHVGPCTHKSAILGRSPRSISRTNAREKLKGPELTPVVCTPCTHNLYQPLCGSDGRTYPNWMCLRNQACKQRKNIQVINPGPCGVGFLKGPYKQTANFFTGVQSQSPECLDCNAMVGKPVCGSDGRTYSNEKCLKSAACQNELKNVRTVAAGPCKFTFTAVPSTKPTRTNFTSTSITIECPAICSDEKKFVCASDGITYPNDCLMRMEACLFKKALQKSFDGKCSEEEDDVDSDDNDEDEDNEDNDNDVEERTESESQKQPESTTAQAVATTSSPETETGQLPTAPDGTKLQKRQQREQRRQQQQKTMTSGNKGNKNRNRNVTKQNNANKKKRRSHRSSDGGVCPVCTRDLDWVCGVDGYTYVNPCSLRHESCIRRKANFIKRPGRC